MIEPWIIDKFLTKKAYYGNPDTELFYRFTIPQVINDFIQYLNENKICDNITQQPLHAIKHGKLNR